MKQADLIERINLSTLVEKKLIANVLACLGDVVTEELEAGGEVTLPGLGKLVSVAKPARTGRNPSTGETIDIPASVVAKFKPAKALKDALNA